MQRRTIEAFRVKSLAWVEDGLIDWVACGNIYRLEGNIDGNGVQYGEQFDACIVSDDHRFAFIYGRLSTKGLLLKAGRLVREINRSYYFADRYEYPVAFTQFRGRTVLIHCPDEYNRIEFEDAETGERLTASTIRKPSDVFHSRFEVSPDNRYLLSKGWCWHPVDVVQAFDIAACIRDPKLLDEAALDPTIRAPLGTASFISTSKVLLGSFEGEEPFYRNECQSPLPGELAVWDLPTNTISTPVKVQTRFGELYAIDEHRCWDLFKYPKIIDITTGHVLEALPDIDSGERTSSIVDEQHLEPAACFNRETGEIVIRYKDRIEVLTP